MTLKVLVSVNLPWESYLCSPFDQHRVQVDLRKKVPSLDSLLTILHASLDSTLVKIEFTDGNCAVFDLYGNAGSLELIGNSLNGQNITTNFDLTSPASKFVSVAIQQSQVVGFDGHTISIFDSSLKTSDRPRKLSKVERQCTKKGLAYPINAIGGVLLSSHMYNRPESVYFNTHLAL
jgi:hypothetical protein